MNFKNAEVIMSHHSYQKDDRGREYQPTNWQGSPPGGHHRKGILEFPELNGETGKITLVIRQVANVPERTFEWSVKH
jgi:hypothetical protein